MSWITVVVALTAGAALIVSVRVALKVLYGASIASEPIFRAVQAHLDAGERERAMGIAEACRPAWLGQVLASAFSPKTSELEGDDLLYSLRAELESLRNLRAWARVASFAGLLGATLELLVVMLAGRSDIPTMASSLANVETTQRAFLALALGMSASMVILYLMITAYKRGAKNMQDCRRAARLLAGHEMADA